MKEATSELNLTAIVLVAIGVMAAFFFTILWPMIDDNFQRNASCRAAACDCSVAARDRVFNNGWGKNMCECDIDGTQIYCPYGG